MGPLLQVVKSWLCTRTAYVVVEGAKLEPAPLDNQVFQGTVWGPPLWNTFFEDAGVPVNAAGFADAFFADDLNCFRDYSRRCHNDALFEDMLVCQVLLHRWGVANRVQFDAAKESMHILDQWEPVGEGFELLGVEFDEGLTMERKVKPTST